MALVCNLKENIDFIWNEEARMIPKTGPYIQIFNELTFWGICTGFFSDD